MINNQYKELAQWAMDFALKNGCQACRISVHAGTESNFDYRNLMLEKLQQSSESSMNIELFVDGRYGTFSTNRIHKQELEKFITQGIISTRYLEPDECRSLPDISLCFNGGGVPDLNLYDNQITDILPDEKLQIALNNVEEVYKTDERIISVNAGYADGDSKSYIIQSNGFEGERFSTWFNINAGVSMKSESDSRPAAGWWDNSLFFNEIKKTGYGKAAYERCKQKLGQKKIQSGTYTMIVDYLNSTRVLTPLLSALYGNSLQQKNSFLLDKIGEKVGSSKFTLVDDPHLPKTPGARYFDYEGVATKKRTIFDKGVLQNYFIDTYYSQKMNVPQTISGPSTLMLQLGDKDLSQLILPQKRAILVTGFNGGNQNSSTGDFSYGIEGFLIENGVATQPISEMNITGNLIELWKNLVETGNDPRLNSSYRIPSLVFAGVNFSGM
jgi:PmbA protein